jgi:hypothetical protein
MYYFELVRVLKPTVSERPGGVLFLGIGGGLALGGIHIHNLPNIFLAP